MLHILRIIHIRVQKVPAGKPVGDRIVPGIASAVRFFYLR